MATGTQILPASTSLPVPRMTAEEFAQRYARCRVELLNGVVVELPMPQQHHGKVCCCIAMAIGLVVEAGDLGHVTTNDSFGRVGARDDPERVRGADVCYFSYDRLPKDGLTPGLISVAPNLVVEVRSPTDPWSEVFTKVGEYLGSGVTAVLVLDPNSGTSSVYRNDPDHPQQILSRSETLTLPDILPGLAIPVSRLFE